MGTRAWAEVNMGKIKIDISFQTLCRYVLDDLYEHPALETDVRELQKLYQLHRRQWVTKQLTFLLQVMMYMIIQCIGYTHGLSIKWKKKKDASIIIKSGCSECDCTVTEDKERTPSLLVSHQWIHSEIEESLQCSGLFCTEMWKSQSSLLWISKDWENTEILRVNDNLAEIFCHLSLKKGHSSTCFLGTTSSLLASNGVKLMFISIPICENTQLFA